MRHFLFVAIAVFVTSVMSFADDSVADTWRYSLTPPADGWQNLGFDDPMDRSRWRIRDSRNSRLAYRHRMEEQRHLASKII